MTAAPPELRTKMRTSLNALRLSGSRDLSTPEGRSRERYRRAFFTTISSAASRITTASITLISVPLTLHYLGVERYGLWITISSLIAFLGFSDLGINMGLMNGISKANGTDDRLMAQRYVSSAFSILTIVASILGLLFVLVYRSIPWGSFFHVKSTQALTEAGPAAATFVLCFLIGIPAGIVTRVQSGYQEGFTAGLWSLIGSIFSLLAVLLVIHLKGSLPLLVLAMAGTPVFFLAVNSLVLFGFQRPWLRPSLTSLSRPILLDLIRSGFLFFVLQICLAIGYSSDNIVVARVLGPEAVTQYSVPSKLFGFITVIGGFALSPLWPAYTEALVRRDIPWVKRTFKRSAILSFSISTALAIILVLSGPILIRLWVGPKIVPTPLLLLGLGTWSVVAAISNPVAMLLNAASVLKFQLIVVPIAAIVNIALSIYLTYRIGAAGVVFGSIISQVAVVMIPYLVFIRRFFEGLETGNPK